MRIMQKKSKLRIKILTEKSFHANIYIKLRRQEVCEKKLKIEDKECTVPQVVWGELSTQVICLPQQRVRLPWTSSCRITNNKRITSSGEGGF